MKKYPTAQYTAAEVCKLCDVSRSYLSTLMQGRMFTDTGGHRVQSEALLTSDDYFYARRLWFRESAITKINERRAAR